MPEVDLGAPPKREGVARTLLVAFIVSLVCSSLVASAAVVLKPLQEANARLDARKNILDVAGIYDPVRDINEQFARIEARIVELETGVYRDDVDPDTFDPERARKDPERSVVVPADSDVARIGRRAELALVYLVRDGDSVSRIILPVFGYGLWSTMYGFVALEPDGNTVADIVFYAHAETAGIGDFVSKPKWRSLWPKKRAFDENGQLLLRVVKGRVSPDDPLADYHVDGVSGATLTGNGVTNLIQYWLGPRGYGPYLRNIRRGAGT